jgi:hypothetical protein
MIGIILELALIGLIVWAVITYVPMPQPIKTLIVVFVVILLVLWLLQIFGFSDLPVPHLHRLN